MKQHDCAETSTKLYGCEKRVCVCVCVCVCVLFPIYFSERRVPHFAVYSGDYTLQRIFLSF